GLAAPSPAPRPSHPGFCAGHRRYVELTHSKPCLAAGAGRATQEVEVEGSSPSLPPNHIGPLSPSVPHGICWSGLIADALAGRMSVMSSTKPGIRHDGAA